MEYKDDDILLEKERLEKEKQENIIDKKEEPTTSIIITSTPPVSNNNNNIEVTTTVTNTSTSTITTITAISLTNVPDNDNLSVNNNNNSLNSNSNNRISTNINNNIVKLEVYSHPIGKYPIHEAVYKNDIETLKLLLGEEGNSNIYLQHNQQQDTHNTSREEEEDEEEENQSNLDISGKPGINERDEQGRTPLMFCNTINTARFLLERGAKVNLRDQERQTAMHKASIYNIPTLLSQYLDLGAHIKRDLNGCTPLHICATKGHVKCAQTMMEKGPRRVKAEARDKAGKTPLHYASETIESNDETSAQIIQILVGGGSLLDCKDREKKTPLHHATIQGKVKSVNVLLDKGANTDITDMFGALPLHYAVTCVTGRKIAKQLIIKGSKVNAPDNIGQTPIFYASKSGLPKNVTSLLRMGALATVKDYQSKTPLHFSLDIANPTISSMLVSAGADVTLRYKYGTRGEKGYHSVSKKWKGEANNEVIDEEINHADTFGFLPDISLTASQLKRWNECKDFYSDLFKDHHDREQLREKKWLKVIKQWNDKYKNKLSLVQSKAWKTVPESVRGSLWRLILNPDLVKQQHADRVNYQQLLELNSEFVKQIDLDIDRTYRNHYIFRERFNEGQQSLFNVLKAYSVYDPEVGYCQGMSGLAAILLMYLTEEESFWGLVNLMENEMYQFRGLFLPSFPLLYKSYSCHENLFHQELPKLQNHFNVEGVNSSMYCTKWFLTAFSGTIPFPILVRFWDVILLNGYYIVHSFAIQILREYADTLINEPFEKILAFFSTLEFVKLNIYDFFKSCKKNRVSEKKIEKLIKQYQLQQAQLHINPLPIKPRSASIFSSTITVTPTTTTTTTTTV